MLSGEEHSTRSPTESIQTESAQARPATILSEQMSHHSSATEEDNNYDIKSAFPLPSNLFQTVKSPSTSKSSHSTRSTPKSMSTSKNTPKPMNHTSEEKPAPRGVSDGLSKFAQMFGKQSSTKSEPKQTTTQTLNRVSARDVENENPPLIYSTEFQSAKKNQSVFEKVDLHDGHTTYLGTGSFLRLEDCIQDCLSRDKPCIDLTRASASYSYSPICLPRVSMLQDYCYDGILSPSCHVVCPSSCCCCHTRDQRKSASELCLSDLRQVNDTLSKYGISVHSHNEHDSNPYNRPRPIGDILSACQLLMNDPTLALYRRPDQAVQHVWDAMRYSQPYTNYTNVPGYASPAVRSVASHLFNPPNQAPYNPVQSVASQLFSSPPQIPPNPVQNFVSNPVQNVAPNPPSASQSVLSRLFSGA